MHLFRCVGPTPQTDQLILEGCDLGKTLFLPLVDSLLQVRQNAPARRACAGPHFPGKHFCLALRTKHRWALPRGSKCYPLRMAGGGDKRGLKYLPRKYQGTLRVNFFFSFWLDMIQPSGPSVGSRILSQCECASFSGCFTSFAQPALVAFIVRRTEAANPTHVLNLPPVSLQRCNTSFLAKTFDCSTSRLEVQAGLNFDHAS